MAHLEATSVIAFEHTANDLAPLCAAKSAANLAKSACLGDHTRACLLHAALVGDKAAGQYVWLVSGRWCAKLNIGGMMARRRQANSEETWNQVVRAAQQLLAREGLRGFSLRRVADGAGYGLSTLQHYFSNKQRLLDTAAADAYERNVMPALKEATDALERGAALTEVGPRLTLRFYRFAREYGHLAHTRLTSNLFAGGMSEVSVAAHLSASRALVSALDGQEADQARIRAGLHSMVVLSLRYASHSAAELVQILGTDTEREALDVVESHLEQLARGIANELQRNRLA